GHNQNNGLSPQEPLKNIYYALLKLHTDENNPGRICMADGLYGNYINNESFPLLARDYTSLIGESEEGVIWDGQDTTSMITSYNTLNDFAIENITALRAGNPNIETPWFSFLLFNSVKLKNISISETSILNRLIYNGQRYADSSYFKNIRIENTHGNAAFSIKNYQPNTQQKYCELINIQIIRHLPIFENEWNGSGSALQVHGSDEAQKKVEIKNLLLSENQYEDNIWIGASAMALSNGDYTLTNATIAHNLSDGPSCAVHLANGQFKIYNSIFYGLRSRSFF
ncbi:MAG: hypothetical protein B7C24_04785, partial [Bacteroidetes bacterium 4572_77]